jgi:hypothetical protein
MIKMAVRSGSAANTPESRSSVASLVANRCDSLHFPLLVWERMNQRVQVVMMGTPKRYINLSPLAVQRRSGFISAF